MNRTSRSRWRWIVGGTVALVAVSVAVAAYLRDRHTESPQPFHVLVWIESTPPGAAVVRRTDNLVLGLTPDTFEFLQSKAPVPIRIVKDGFVAAERDVLTESDGTLSVALDAVKSR